MQWKIFLLLLGYIVADFSLQAQGQFNINNDEQYRKSLEAVRQQQRSNAAQQTVACPCGISYRVIMLDVYLSCKPCESLPPALSNSRTNSGQRTQQSEVQQIEQKNSQPASVHAQGGNGATGGNGGPIRRKPDEAAATNQETDQSHSKKTNGESLVGREGAGLTNRETFRDGNLPSLRQQGDNSMYKFHQTLFRAVAPPNIQRNVLYSPLSLNYLLAFIYTGANGRTADELRKTLDLPEDRKQVGEEFKHIKNGERLAGETQLLTANKMYYNENLQLYPQAVNIAHNYFNAEIEAIDFRKKNDPAAKINNWIEQKTQGQLLNLVAPGSLDARTSAVLVNAIYFKAKWEKEFSTSDTQKADFMTLSGYTVPVDMMYTDDVFNYADLDDLQATALELPYKDTDLSMLIILPKETNGLKTLENRLSHMDFSSVVDKMKPESVTVRLPKFRIKYEQDMVEPLIITGINELFTSQANVTGFFQGPNQPTVSQIKQKAFIDVNEAGSEAAAASFAKFIPLSLPAKPIYFTADHPFMFVVRSRYAVYFAGHVVNF